MEKKNALKNIFVLAVFALAVLSCDSKVKFDKDEFDTEKWKNDRNGCNNVRISQLQNFRKVKNRLMDLNEREIRQTLGKPDQIELYKRKQKFYVYFLDKGGQCEGEESNKGQYIEIRFSALERVNEISYRPATQ